MLAETDKRPLASEIYEETALELFALTSSPEEYAARKGAGWMCFSFDEYRYRNHELDIWIQRLGEILRAPGLLEEYQMQR